MKQKIVLISVLSLAFASGLKAPEKERPELISERPDLFNQA
jgi:hypothetical protein